VRVEECVSEELPDSIYSDVTRLSEEGSRLMEAGRPAEARSHWLGALELTPEPSDQWEAATWLLTSIGDTFFEEASFAEALPFLQRAVRCPGGLGNAYIHLRLGEVQFELGNMQRARDELARAFMGGGDELFSADDPKYSRFIREILRPPANEVGE
jgi:tetratricopeptide (TPR) repeat protein